MTRIFGLLLGGAGLAATSLAAEPRLLGPGELDTVAAGFGAAGDALAAATGNAVFTSTDTAAVANVQEGPAPGIYGTTSAGGGTAIGAAAGEGSGFVLATGADSEAEGTWTRTNTIGGALAGRTVGISATHSHSVGITGAWLLDGGP